jgi:hypothetical protein
LFGKEFSGRVQTKLPLPRNGTEHGHHRLLLRSAK